MAKFVVPTKKVPTITEAYSEIIGSNNNTIIQLPIDSLQEIDNQPFPINENKIEQIADSIKAVGLLEPIIVKVVGDKYCILAGIHRYRACKKLKYDKVPCIVSSADDDNARLILLTTNIDRNNEYPPSVYAKAFKEQIDILDKLGSNNQTVSEIAKRQETNRKTIYRYIRLLNLNQNWLDDIDNNVVPMSAGVEISYLDNKDQSTLYSFFQANNDIKLNVDNMKSIRCLDSVTEETLRKVFGIKEKRDKEEKENKIDTIIDIKKKIERILKKSTLKYDEKLSVLYTLSSDIEQGEQDENNNS